MRYAVALLASVFLTIPASGAAAVVEPDATNAVVRSCTGGDVRLKSAQKRMLQLYNNERVDRDLPRLCVHLKLQKAAEAHSRDMIRKDRFWHGNVGRRLHRFDYQWRSYGEIIFRDRGRPSPETAFRAWMKSSTHRRNILDRSFDEVGIGAENRRRQRLQNYRLDRGPRNSPLNSAAEQHPRPP